MDRVDALGEAIRKLPDGESEFGYEIGLLGKVSGSCKRRRDPAQPETGSTAIAAETEAIELLLQSKRINPKGGGGGGCDPGRRRTWQDARLGAGTLWRRRQREGSAGRPRRLPSDR